MSFIAKLPFRQIKVPKNICKISKYTHCQDKTVPKAKMAAKTALLVIADGTEDMEAVITIDILRRAGVEVTVAGIHGIDLVTCSNKIQIKPDESLCNARTKNYDVIIMPGGLGGTNAFIESPELGKLLQQQDSEGKLIAAICAAPTALLAHKIGLGKCVTSYPAMKDQLVKDYQYKEQAVVVDGNLITSRGPGTAVPFGLKLAEILTSCENAKTVAEKALLTM